eukprot:TRINITY_DN1808_c0_g1_i2.p1 TRINITY_DN1808_c0_g1~~TRINITY_DN1808_c0_g1_i2.p1  ORF type:complete len:457 (-),score=86.08 TRINITY_DN1808_c0_g1_i2:9-1379(-)
MNAGAPPAVVLCHNCRKEVPAENAPTHDVFCRRNIQQCPVCNVPVRVADAEAHAATHVLEPCSKCEQRVEHSHMEQHLESECPKRATPCSFCSLSIPADEHERHEAYCGSRTDQCAACSKYIRLRDMAKHVSSKCKYPPSTQSSISLVVMDSGKPSRSGSFSESEALLDMIRAEVMASTNTSKTQVQVRVPSPGAVECPWCLDIFKNYEDVQLHMLTLCPHRGDQLGANPGLLGIDTSLPQHKPSPVISRLQSAVKLLENSSLDMNSLLDELDASTPQNGKLCAEPASLPSPSSSTSDKHGVKLGAHKVAAKSHASVAPRASPVGPQAHARATARTRAYSTPPVPTSKPKPSPPNTAAKRSPPLGVRGSAITAVARSATPPPPTTDMARPRLARTSSTRSAGAQPKAAAKPTLTRSASSASPRTSTAAVRHPVPVAKKEKDAKVTRHTVGHTTAVQ